MWTAREIWEAGRAALAAQETPPVPPPAVSAPVEVEEDSEIFNPTAFDFEARPYRVTFRGGTSGEYDGAELARQFPFDPREVRRVEPVDEVGQWA
jgi:hypothetical protein